MPKALFAGKSRQEAISHPVLHNTDALPRNDLHALNGAATCRPPVVRDFHRPRTSDRQEKQAPAPVYLNYAVSPAGNLDESMIGIALGSPRLVDSQMYSHMRNDSCCSAAESQRPGLAKSRWRKIGGLFKAKRAFAPSQPFYQLRVDNDWPLQDSTYSIDVEDEHSKGPIQEDCSQDEWPRFKPQSKDDSAKDSQPQMKAQDADTSPLLQVDIPNVEMERYSVMFSGLLGKPPARKNRIADASSELPPDLPPLPRPATSPRPKSPSFTLFPATHASKPSKVLGTHNLPGPSSPVRSQTAPPDQASERAPWPSPMVSPASRRPPSDCSSTTIDLNDDGPPLEQSKPTNPTRTLTPQPPSNPRKPPRTTPPTLRINTNLQSLRPPAPRSSSLSPNTISKRPSPSTPKPKPDVSPRTPDAAPNSQTPIPRIEVSVARSVSVARGNKQALVPVRRGDCLDAEERIVDRGAKTPLVMGGKYGHRHGNSQDVRIESV